MIDSTPKGPGSPGRKALREKGAVKLQLAGTKSADQALLALRDLNLHYSHLDWGSGAPLGGSCC